MPGGYQAAEHSHKPPNHQDKDISTVSEQEDNEGSPGVYAAAYQQYLDKGWTHVFPTGFKWVGPKGRKINEGGPGRKNNPPTGVTGYKRHVPTADETSDWVRDVPHYNIALGMPDRSMAFDVDDHDHETGKFNGVGSATMAEIARTAGDLPSTYRSTRHAGDHTAGHRPYALQEGMDAALLSDLPGVELLLPHWRLSVVWPSTYKGLTYGWLDPQGRPCDIPNFPDVPELPWAWYDEIVRRAGNEGKEAGTGGSASPTVAHRLHANKGEQAKFDAAYASAIASGWTVGPYVAPREPTHPWDVVPDSGVRTQSAVVETLERARRRYVDTPDHSAALWNYAVQVGRLVPHLLDGDAAYKLIVSAVDEARYEGHLDDRSEGGCDGVCTRQILKGLTEGLCSRWAVMEDPPAKSGPGADLASSQTPAGEGALEGSVVEGEGDFDHDEKDPCARAGTGSESELAIAAACSLMAGKFKLAGGLGWLHWTGKVWAACDVALPLTAVQDGLFQMKTRLEAEMRDLEARHDALEPLDPARKDLTRRIEIVESGISFVQANLNLRKLKALTELAGMRPNVRVDVDELDAHPDQLNVANGVINLWDGSMTPHHPDLLMTKISPVMYRQGATSPDWDAVCASLSPNVLRYLQDRLGQAITGHSTPDHAIPFNTGDGMNGKSLMFDHVRRVLGAGYCHPVSHRALIGSPDQHPTEFMAFRGARVAILEELPEGNRINVQRLKVISGDVMQARLMRQDEVTWKSTHSLFVNTNYTLIVNETDDGSWRRIVQIPWDLKYLREPRPLTAPHHRRADEGLTRRLEENTTGSAEACLTWLVEGSVAWYAADRKMMSKPAEVVGRSALAREDSDDLGRYLDERLELNADSCVSASELLMDFNEWLKSNGAHPWSATTFGTRLRQHERFTEAGVKRSEKPERLATRNGLSRRNAFAAGQPVTSGVARVYYGIKFAA